MSYLAVREVGWNGHAAHVASCLKSRQAILGDKVLCARNDEARTQDHITPRAILRARSRAWHRTSTPRTTPELGNADGQPLAIPAANGYHGVAVAKRECGGERNSQQAHGSGDANDALRAHSQMLTQHTA